MRKKCVSCGNDVDEDKFDFGIHAIIDLVDEFDNSPALDGCVRPPTKAERACRDGVVCSFDCFCNLVEALEGRDDDLATL